MVDFYSCVQVQGRQGETQYRQQIEERRLDSWITRLFLPSKQNNGRNQSSKLERDTKKDHPECVRATAYPDCDCNHLSSPSPVLHQYTLTPDQSCLLCLLCLLPITCWLSASRSMDLSTALSILVLKVTLGIVYPQAVLDRSRHDLQVSRLFV